jgi:hypothetical protein
MSDQPDPNGATDVTPTPMIPHEHSLYVGKFNITSFEHDPKKWNGDWEKVLRTLSSADVYADMGERLANGPRDILSQLHQSLERSVLHHQSGFTEMWDKLVEEQFEYFRTSWLLLDEKERTRHLFKGLEKATQHSGFGQDARALCPEITMSAMLKQKGVPFIDFLSTYQAKLKEVTAGHPYLVASEWWDKAPQDIPQSLSETFPTLVLEILTLMRNYFIGESLSTLQVASFNSVLLSS